MTQTLLTSDDLKQQIKCVSHEIRNHLSICDMYSQIIRKTLEKEGISTPSIQNAIDCIQQSIKIIGTNLLDLKSINSSAIQILDFEKTVKKGIEMSKAYVEDKNIEYEVLIKNTQNIEIDENRFLSCFINIIKNGIEAIEIKGKISIIAEVKDNFAYIKITNNGRPIPKDKQETIFDLGYTTKKTGCGIGLALCRQYLKEQNATLELIKSVKGQTTFEIRINF
ncbi:HAMP domain-containing histidine kinase [bacterium]|nr:HAMP domain-containing histidine kinase [bacterium]